MKKVFIGLSIPINLRDELLKEAESNGLSLSSYIRMILIKRK